MLAVLLKNRFEIFLVSQVLILFGSLVFPIEFFENRVLPLLFLLNIGAGIALISQNKLLVRIFAILFITAALTVGISFFTKSDETEAPYLLRFIPYFIFQLMVTYQIVLQVWNAQKVNKKVIIGLMSGYIAIGFLAFFLFLTIEVLQPGSFNGPLLNTASFELRAEALMYFAYITLMTIGYGDVVPVTAVAQKAAMLVGLIGQFYLVIITAIVVGKFLSQSNWNKQQ